MAGDRVGRPPPSARLKNQAFSRWAEFCPTGDPRPPARCRFHFQHESAKAETPEPLWTNQILGFSEFRFSGFRVGGDFKGRQPLAWLLKLRLGGFGARTSSSLR